MLKRLFSNKQSNSQLIISLLWMKIFQKNYNKYIFVCRIHDYTKTNKNKRFLSLDFFLVIMLDFMHVHKNH
jgi:hypothetical protein